jgi:hypothetical protein
LAIGLIAAGAAMACLSGSATAFPSATPNAAEGAARLDGLLKPPFGALIHPHLYRYYPHRPSWAGNWSGGYYGGYGDPCAQGYGGYSGGGYPGGGYVDGAYPGGFQGGGCTGGAYPDGAYQAGCATSPLGGGYILDGRYIPVGGGAYGGCQGAYPSGTYSPGYPGGGYPGVDAGLPSWGWNPAVDVTSWGPPQIYPLGGGTDHITVDCRDPGGPRLNSALSQLAPGGTLYLRGHGPACEETLQIQQPVIIAGEPDAAFPIHGDPGPAVIEAPPGQPCAIIAVGPRGGVEFRDVVLEAPHGGGSACIQSWGSAVALVRSTVNHSGEASAVYASGGQLFFSDAEIDGASEDSVIWAEDAAIVFKNVGVKAVSTAIDIRPGGANSVLLDHVTLYAPPGEAEHTATGLLARRSHTLNGHFELHHVQISGFRNGVVAENGVDLHIDRVLIGHARLGVAVNGATVDIHDSGIDARDWGVYAYAGQVKISRTHIFSFTHFPIGSDPGAAIDDHDIWAYGDHCGFFDHPHWGCRDRRSLAPYFLESDFRPHHWGWDAPL